MATVVKDSRFDMRLTIEQRKEIERAASIQGKTLTQWALDSLLASARHDIEEETVTRLSAEAFDEFVAAVDSPMPQETIELLSRKPVWE